MDLENIAQIAAVLLKNRKSHRKMEYGRIYYHGQRVAKLAVYLRERLLPDDAAADDILTVAGWFHDIAKGIEPHAYYGDVLTRAALEKHVPPDALDEICMLIRHHWSRKSLAPPPGHEPFQEDFSDRIRIFQDADLLDHFGTADIWIDFHTAAFNEDSVEDRIRAHEAQYAQRAEKHRYALNFPLSRRIFDDRTAYSQAFFRRFAMEGRGGVVEESVAEETG
jgi:uncharacterized protein